MINEEEEEDSTMKQYDTAPGGSKYRPEFLDHFDKKVEESKIFVFFQKLTIASI